MSHTIDDKDSRAFVQGAEAVEALLDADMPVRTQHTPNRQGLPSCGAATGAVLTGVVTKYAITCEACLAKFNARQPRGRRGR